MTRGQKIGTVLGTIAAIVTIIDITIDRVNLIQPLWQLLIDVFTYQLPVYSFLIALLILLFLLKAFRSSNSKQNDTQELFGVLSLNDDWEARYSYYLGSDGRITLNHMRNPDGYTLYCSTHDLRLNSFVYTGDLICPDCQTRKRIGATPQEIISRIERQIRRSLASGG